MKMTNQIADHEAADSDWKSLHKVGGVAALIAGVIFRRNLGVEISLFSARKQPDTVNDWFTLLQNNRFLGLSYLNLFDLVNYALVGLMFLALYVALRRASKSSMAIATMLGFVGIAVYFASNTDFSMLSLSDQYNDKLAKDFHPRAPLGCLARACQAPIRSRAGARDPRPASVARLPAVQVPVTSEVARTSSQRGGAPVRHLPGVTW
jgi:hypothetical protein